jgi:hypothetical protein
VKKPMFFAVIAGCVMSTSALASGWGAQTTITGFFIDPPTGKAGLTTATNQNIDNCQYSSYLFISASHPRFKELYATLVAAQLTGSTVALYYDGCQGNYPIISSIAVPAIW